MPSVRAKRIRHNKFRDDNGNIIEVKMWQVTPSTDKPHGYKYSLVYIVNGKRVIGYDNAEGKGDNRHYRDNIEQYQFKYLRSLSIDISLFYPCNAYGLPYL